MIDKYRELQNIYKNEGFYQALKSIYGFFYRRTIDPIKETTNIIWNALRHKQYLGAIGSITELITGENIQTKYLSWRYGRYVKINTNGYDMYVDIDDPGLSKELLTFGIREELSTRRFEQELRRLRNQAGDEITVLEIGANIGYFALLEAKVLGNKANIHAFEPSPSNFDLLERNINLNNFQEQFTINHSAVGESSGTVAMELTEQSNRNRVDDPNINKENNDDLVIDRVEVPITSIEEYMTEKNLSPEDIDVLRMDVQGFEYNVFKGATELLSADSPLLVFIETHPHFINLEKQQSVINDIRDAGLTPIFSADNFSRTEIKQPEDLLGTSTEVILVRD